MVLFVLHNAFQHSSAPIAAFHIDTVHIHALWCG